MDKHIPNKTFQFLLVGYMVIQSLSLIVHNLWLYVSYELVFISMLLWAVVVSIKQIKETGSFKETKAQVVFLLAVGLLLTVFYLITIILDPSIELKLNPDLNNFQSLLIFFPLTQSIIASLIISLSSGLTKLLKLH